MHSSTSMSASGEVSAVEYDVEGLKPKFENWESVAESEEMEVEVEEMTKIRKRVVETRV